MRLYVIRHGESENNKNGFWTGWDDPALTDKGIRDALATRKVLSEVHFDKVYSSDLIRAVQTAQNAIEGCDPERLPIIREINVGTLGSKPLNIISDEERADVIKNGYEKFGGETRAQFKERIAAFKSFAESLEYENVAVFAHAGWLMGFLNQALGTSLLRKNFICNNCAIGVFDYDGTNWRLYSWINVT